MCIVFVANNAQPRYKYVILSNRDEDFARPTVRSAFWTTYPLSPLEDALATPTFLSPSATPSLSMANPDSQAQELVEILSGMFCFFWLSHRMAWCLSRLFAIDMMMHYAH